MTRIKIILFFICLITVEQAVGQRTIPWLPNLSNGKSFEKGLAKYLDMRVFPEFSSRKKSLRYKQHSIFIEILLDTDGSATLNKTKHNRGEIPIDKIKSFVESQQFDTSLITNETEVSRLSGWIRLMNKNKKEAKRERKQEILDEREEYNKRLIADSINGILIPRNLEESFIELNKLLTSEDIEAIKSLNDRSETISYHFGLGMWLRNNWGFWGGSRLQQYLIKKGFRHPDDMSATILKFYYDWLNEQHDEWKKFERK